MPSVQLSVDIGIVNSLMLRSICLQSACMWLFILKFEDKVCLAPPTKKFCNQAANSEANSSPYYGLYFRIQNLGARQQGETNYTILLPYRQKLFYLYQTRFELNTVSDKISIALDENDQTIGTPVSMYGKNEVIRLGNRLHKRYKKIYLFTYFYPANSDN